MRIQTTDRGYPCRTSYFYCALPCSRFAQPLERSKTVLDLETGRFLMRESCEMLVNCLKVEGIRLLPMLGPQSSGFAEASL